jgi:pimeloyl-ACP methyl ester carboxylesterase
MNAGDWEAMGRTLPTKHGDVFVVDVPATRDEGLDPLLVLHGFPSSSYDWHLVLDSLRSRRRVVLPDFLGFGCSAKPDMRYGIRMQADAIEAVAAQLGLASVALLTHDMGNSVGGELLARALPVSQRVLTNGSIYIDMAQLTAGQQLLLSLDDVPTELINADGYKAGVAGTFSPASDVAADELDALWNFMARADGQRLLPRTIRYIEDRRKEERRYTGAIETHPSPVGVVWGRDDPVAVVAMTETFHTARADAPMTILDDVGHYPMLEAPDRFAAAVTQFL